MNLRHFKAVEQSFWRHLVEISVYLSGLSLYTETSSWSSPSGGRVKFLILLFEQKRTSKNMRGYKSFKISNIVIKISNIM